MLKQNQKENRDIFGTKWDLAPGGKAVIDECQSRIFKIHLELSGYSALFRNLNNCEFKTEELYGMSLLLERMSRRLEKISDLLVKAISEETKSDQI